MLNTNRTPKSNFVMEEVPIPTFKELNPLNWDYLGRDLTELILSLLPISSIVRSSAVCKQWHSIVAADEFSTRVSASKKPWFFLCGQNNIISKNNQTFAYDPEADEWINLPTTLYPWPSSQESSFAGSGGFFFCTAAAKFSYSPILKASWRQTPPLRYSRCSPLVGVSNDGVYKFIVVGGVRFIGGLVDIEDILAVEIYDPSINSWKLCPPLPADFRSLNTSQWLSSALFKGKLYVFGIYSSFVSSFDLNKHFWSDVKTLRPPGVLFSFLISCHDQLVLAGLCNSPKGPTFILWGVDEKSMEFREIALMPQELLSSLFDGEEDDNIATLKCVGLGNVIYVFNEDHYRNFPACICEIRDGKCSWRKVPNLSSISTNRFHKVISFCSTVLLGNTFEGEEEEEDVAGQDMDD